MSIINQVHVGPGGTFEASGEFSTDPGEVDVLFDHLRTSDEKAITIHFHGGLVKESSGVKTAKMMKRVYEEANNYPLSFVWETGLLETFRQNLTSIHKTKLFQKILKLVLKRVGERFGGFNARGAGTPIPMDEIEEELKKEFPFADYDQKDTGKGASRGGAIAVREENLEDIREELIAEFEEDIDADDEFEKLFTEKDEGVEDASQRGIFTAAKAAAKIAKIAYRVIRRHVRDRDHGFYPTVVEEILREYYVADLGAWVWGRMKDKAAAMWLPNDGLVGDEQRAGAYVLDAIEKLQANKDIAINLVGHSAGAIAICHLLAAAAARHPGIRINHVVFLAPAVRSDLALAEVATHSDRYQQFRIFTMSDSYERDDVLVKFVYTRSLLYFISGVLEPDMVDQPIAGMMRHATQRKPFQSGAARKWADFILDMDRTVLADSSDLDPSAPEGRRTTSRKHGDFDNDPKTQESLQHVIKV